ncbi:MAG: glycosyltransferase [Bacteroidia bacterium]|nr:glycosyltransferase [Bacteroidia bacterium]
MSDFRKNVFVSVVSDLVTDQRVHRSSLTLSRKGLKVTLVGRKLHSSLPIEKREYEVKRFKLWAEKGPLFYAFYNCRLFFFLLFRKVDVLLANDLDTLPANFIISRIKGIPLYYDSHEYFTGVPELEQRSFVRSVWKWLERKMLPHIKHVYTVNDSIANLYKQEYKIDPVVIRNLPMRESVSYEEKSKEELGFPPYKKILLFQGAGINMHRGAEEMVLAMKKLDDFILVFIGSGDVIDFLKSQVSELGLNERVIFFPKMPLDKLRQFTRKADLGLSLDKDTNINYRFSLPNKLFDYIQAGVPVLASDLPEVRKVVDQYQIGKILVSLDPEQIAKAINDVFNNERQFAVWKENLKFAAEELCWEKEEIRFLEIFKEIL